MSRLKIAVILVLSLAAVLFPNFWVRWLLVVLLGFSMFLMLFWSAEIPGANPFARGDDVPERDEFERVARMISNARRHRTSRRLLREYIAEAYSLMSGEDPDIEYRRIMDNPNEALRLLSSGSTGSEFVSDLKRALDILENDINLKRQ